MGLRLGLEGLDINTVKIVFIDSIPGNIYSSSRQCEVNTADFSIK